MCFCEKKEVKDTYLTSSKQAFLPKQKTLVADRSYRILTLIEQLIRSLSNASEIAKEKHTNKIVSGFQKNQLNFKKTNWF